MAHPYDHADTAAIIDLALREDLGPTGDLTVAALVPDSARLAGAITAKESGVVCGLPLVERVCRAVAARLKTGLVTVVEAASDGTAVAAGTVVLRLEGSAATLLIAERTFLNLAQRLSGTATLAARYARLVAGTKAQIFDTRKTTPGLRLLQKHAVVAGGCRNHRIGLYDQILIKDNHIALMEGHGGPAEAVRRCRKQHPDIRIEVEIERVEDLTPVIAAGADIVLLDNMGVEDLRRAVALRGQASVELEASGGITETTLRAVAQTGVERISIGALTHSAACLDLSLRCRIA